MRLCAVLALALTLGSCAKGAQDPASQPSGVPYRGESKGDFVTATETPTAPEAEPMEEPMEETADLPVDDSIANGAGTTPSIELLHLGGSTAEVVVDGKKFRSDNVYELEAHAVTERSAPEKPASFGDSEERPRGGLAQPAAPPAEMDGYLDDDEGTTAQVIADPSSIVLGLDASGSTTNGPVRKMKEKKRDEAEDGDDYGQVVEEDLDEGEEESEDKRVTTRIAVLVDKNEKSSKDVGGKLGGRASDVGRGKEQTRPKSFLPRKLYFENTYLGGDAAFQEQMRRLNDSLGDQSLPHTRSLGYSQPFDPPEDAGLSLSAELDHRYLEKEGRIILQVGLQGSLRYGWRRPPLDVVLVLDGPALNEDPEMGVKVAGELLNQLGPQDHLAVVVAGPRPLVLAPLGRLRSLRGELALAFDGLGRVPDSTDDALAAAMTEAGELLTKASEDRATLPGTQTVLVVTRGMDGGRVQPAREVAHDLTLMGMVTSVIETGAGDGLWWAVNDAGYGNYHRVEGRDPREAVRAELESLSRVVARLVRINVRLAPGVEAIRILGSRVLDEQEVVRVKAREVAADQNISRTLGVVADRGDDDDGLQTVIPYFYGGDSHVILIELWVDRPGAVADVTLRYKDMVNLGNATARTSVAVRNLPRDETAEQLAVRRNVRGFRIGEALEHASLRLQRGDVAGARSWVNQARSAADRATSADREVVEAFARVLDAGDLSWDTGRRAQVSRSLFVAARRKIGENRALEP